MVGSDQFWHPKLVRPDQITSTKHGPAGPIFSPDQFFRYTQACASSSSCSTKSCGVQTDPIDSSLLLDILNMVPIDSQLPLLSEVFSAYLLTVFKLSVPNDFLHLAASAMLQLANNGRTNVLYNLAKGIGTLRQDEEDTRFPVKRMPMGLVEYTAQFFASDNLQQVRAYKKLFIPTISL